MIFFKENFVILVYRVIRGHDFCLGFDEVIVGWRFDNGGGLLVVLGL